MIERPILFSAPMVRGLLNDTKTQTRRVVNFKGTDLDTFLHRVPNKIGCCPYGQPGHRLWVREAFANIAMYRDAPLFADRQSDFAYRASGDIIGCHKWKRSIHMPRAASRITLEITGVRVERLQDISEADAIAEGIERSYAQWRDYRTDQAVNYPSAATPVESYRTLWESINGPGSWDANPCVWVVEFKRLNQQAISGGHTK
jgi:hypothetical protein